MTQEQPATPGSNSTNFPLFTALSPLISIFTGGAFLNVVAPLILWLIWKDEHPRVDKVGKNVLNSQISWLIWNIAAAIVSTILMLVFIGLITIWIAPILWAVFSVIHAIKVSNGDDNYVMPLTIRFIK